MAVVCLGIPGVRGRIWLGGPRVVPGARASGGRDASACGFGELYGLYVAVRRIGGTGARAHVHIADGVPAVGLVKCRFRRSEGMWRGRQQRSVKTVGSADVGSNPTPATTREHGPQAAETQHRGRFVLCGYVRPAAGACGWLCQIRAQVRAGDAPRAAIRRVHEAGGIGSAGDCQRCTVRQRFEGRNGKREGWSLSTPDARNSAKTCFVAMPITTPAAYADKLGDPEHFIHVLTHLFTPALQEAGLAVIPHLRRVPN